MNVVNICDLFSRGFHVLKCPFLPNSTPGRQTYIVTHRFPHILTPKNSPQTHTKNYLDLTWHSTGRKKSPNTIFQGSRMARTLNPDVAGKVKDVYIHDSPVPILNSLDDLVNELHKVFTFDRVNVDYVKSLLSAYRSKPADWKKYAKFDPFRWAIRLFVHTVHTVRSFVHTVHTVRSFVHTIHTVRSFVHTVVRSFTLFTQFVRSFTLFTLFVRSFTLFVRSFTLFIQFVRSFVHTVRSFVLVFKFWKIRLRNEIIN